MASIDNILNIAQNDIKNQLTEKISQMTNANQNFKNQLTEKLNEVLIKIQQLGNNPKIIKFKEDSAKILVINQEVSALQASLEHIRRELDESKQNDANKTNQLREQTELMNNYENKLRLITEALAQHSQLINSINYDLNIDEEYKQQLTGIVDALDTFITNLDVPNNQGQNPNNNPRGGKKNKLTNKYIKKHKTKKNITKKNKRGEKNKRGGYLIKNLKK